MKSLQEAQQIIAFRYLLLLILTYCVLPFRVLENWAACTMRIKAPNLEDYRITGENGQREHSITGSSSHCGWYN